MTFSAFIFCFDAKLYNVALRYFVPLILFMYKKAHRESSHAADIVAEEYTISRTLKIIDLKQSVTCYICYDRCNGFVGRL